MAENKMEQWLKYLNECKKSTDNIELDPRDIRELIGLLIELKERREREDKELEERSLEIERDDWEREE